MYCRNCGSKLLDSDKFCNNCGTRVINDVEIEKTHKNVIENSNKIQEVTNELPMNWWNFWIYFRFPVGILISFLAFLSTIYYLGNTDIDFYIIIYLATNLAYIILMGFSYYNVFQKKKRGYIIFIYYIIAEALLFSFDLVIQNFSPLHSFGRTSSTYGRHEAQYPSSMDAKTELSRTKRLQVYAIHTP